MIPPETTPPDFTLVKFAGGFVGGVLSLIYIPPKNLRELIGRMVFSTIVGGSGAFVVLERFSWRETVEHWFWSAIMVGGFAWIAAGVGVRVVGLLGKAQASKEEPPGERKPGE